MSPSSYDISQKRLMEYAGLNLAGYVIPFLLSLAAIPLLITKLGLERFGILTLFWGILYYFSMFDLGLGRALTYFLSEKLAKKAPAQEISQLIWSGLIFLLLTGMVCLLFGLLLFKPLLYHFLNIPPQLEKETLDSLTLLIFAIPLLTVISGIKGILQAYHHFRLLNIIQISIGIILFICPLIALSCSVNLFHIISLQMFFLMVCFTVLIKMLFSLIPNLRKHFLINFKILGQLMSYGGWLSVSNFIGPLLVYADRFVLGALISVAAVSYYTTPFEIATKLWIIPTAITSVLFASISKIYKEDLPRTKELLYTGFKYILIFVFPLSLVLMVFAPELLAQWLNVEFAEHSAKVLQWLTLGVFVNCFAQILINFVWAAGRPDIPAKFHLLEMPLYIGFLYIAIKKWGIEGAALAWSARTALDSFLLFLAAKTLLAIPFKKLIPVLTGFLVCISFLIFSLFMKTSAEKFTFLSITLIIFISINCKSVLQKRISYGK